MWYNYSTKVYCNEPVILCKTIKIGKIFLTGTEREDTGSHIEKEIVEIAKKYISVLCVSLKS